MNSQKINIRDPFVLYEDGIYYLYGSRAQDFAMCSGGFDVYTSQDLSEWSAPRECFDSRKYHLNQGANWAPEVHKYRGAYYMFATFARPNGRKGTYILKAESPLGPFAPHSNGAVTPADWECLDGTLYIDKNRQPYIAFCHEHMQITDGTICLTQLKEDLSAAEGEPHTLFAASSCPWADILTRHGHYVTDGPFFYRTKTEELLMIWSSFIKDQYAEMLLRFEGGEPLGTPIHLPPLIDNDGGHGMIFEGKDGLYLTFHSPNQRGEERPIFLKIEDKGDSVSLC